MKNRILILINILLISFIIILTDAIAEQRMITFEMGESGQTVSFPMSQEEMAFADDVAAFTRSSKITDDTIPKRLVNRIELPESGQFVEFPMTKKEIQKAKKQLAQKKSNINHRNLNAPNIHEKKGDVIEMVDGYSIVFYEDNTTKFGYYPIQ